MVIPDIWFTLYSLANKGAIHSMTTITTRELGEILNVSQQTASRRIAQHSNTPGLQARYVVLCAVHEGCLSHIDHRFCAGLMTNEKR